MTVSSAQIIAFGLGLLVSALELVDLSLQTLQFQPFGLGRVSSLLFAGPPLGVEQLRLTLLGLPSLDLQPVRLDAFLAPTLPFQSLRLLGRSLSLCLEPLRLLCPGALGSQLSRSGKFGLHSLGLAPFRLESRLLHELQLQLVRADSLCLKPCGGCALPLCLEDPQIGPASGCGGRCRVRSSRWQRCPRHRLSAPACRSARGIIGLRGMLHSMSYRGGLASGRVRLNDAAVLQQVISQIVQG